MKRVYVLAEGQTEETFLRAVLAPHLQRFDVHLTPILMLTKRAKSGSKFKGGVTSYAKAQQDLRQLLRDSSVALVTTMIDYYGLPEDFPGVSTLPLQGSCYQRVEHLEAAWRDDARDPRFLPYLSLHEFEALLLVMPDEIARTLQQRSTPEALRKAGASKRSPEEINDGFNTHPAARITGALPAYRKPLHGPLVAARIGLERIREKCPHFSHWVGRLEALGRD